MIGHKARMMEVSATQGARLRSVNGIVGPLKKLLRRSLLDVVIIRVSLIAAWGALGRGGRCCFRLRLG
jgi:hypothetical protein